MSTPLIQFYRGQGPDSVGRTLREILGWDHRRLEIVHDYIQWLFPLRARSQFNPDAPLLDDETIRIFQADDALRSVLLDSFHVMLSFYGFEEHEKDGRLFIGPAADWNARQRNWFSDGNHNLLRITRILTCLQTLGLSRHAQAFLAALETVCEASPGVVGRRTQDFWRNAIL